MILEPHADDIGDAVLGALDHPGAERGVDLRPCDGGGRSAKRLDQLHLHIGGNGAQLQPGDVSGGLYLFVGGRDVAP